MEDTRKIAIYSRKSKFTGKGESIGNQIELCKAGIRTAYSDISDDAILIFEDEGFSGGNTNRPQFQEMMKLCRKRKIKCIVCYRLDRISRNICDYTSMIEELNQLDISFISITEKFDTTSAIGRTMMNIASVFAQFERETIAERIRDNMLELAKDGRWLGGNTPTGYRSVETICSITMDGRKRKARKLEIIPDEAKLIQLIFSKFLEFHSLTKTETYLIQNNYITKTGKYFSRFAIKGILMNPIYLKADEAAWNYFDTKEVEVFSDRNCFDGNHGVIAYNKTKQQTGHSNKVRDIKDWIIAVGKHEGIISGEDWCQTQKLLAQNKSKSYRKPRSNVALLSGLLFCGDCGSFMRPKLSQRINQDGEFIYDYLCELKEKSKRQKCSMKRINGNELDQAISNEIKKITSDESELLRILKKEAAHAQMRNTSHQKKILSLKRNKSYTECKIKNLIALLEKAEDTAAHKYILEEINTLDKAKIDIEAQIQEYEGMERVNALSDLEFEGLAKMLCSFADSFETMPLEQKRFTIKTFVRKIVWDGSQVHIYFLGNEDDKTDISQDALLEPQREGYK